MSNFTRAAVAGLALAALLAACAPSQSRPAPHAKTPAANPLTQDLGFQGRATTVTQADPKHPTWLLWKLVIRHVVGNLVSSESVSGHGVTATLYKLGKPAGVMVAPAATGYLKSNKIVASGGVVYSPITPPGTQLRANTVTWYTNSKTGVARGNVHYHDRSGRSAAAPFLYFNSGLKIISSTPLAGSG